jgi:hypothetical protein
METIAPTTTKVCNHAEKSDIKEGDIIEGYEEVEIKQTL